MPLYETFSIHLTHNLSNTTLPISFRTMNLFKAEQQFSDLTLELVDLIIEKLSTPAMVSLSQTCKSLRQITDKHLYKHVDHSFALFRTIRKRPELAKLVKAYRYDLEDASKLRPKTRVETVQHNELVQEMSDLFGLTEGYHWWEYLATRLSWVEFEVCWLPTQFVNLESLGTGFVLFDEVTPISIAQHGLNRTMLRNLKEAVIETMYHEGGELSSGESWSVSLLSLPGLQSFKLRDVGWHFYNGPGLLRGEFPSQTSLTTLAIEWTPLDVGDIEGLLSCSPKLVEFRWWTMVFDFQRPQFLNISTVGNGLRQCKRLERIDIRFLGQSKTRGQDAAQVQRWLRGGSAEAGGQWGISGKIGSLRKLVRLSEVGVPLCAMFGWEPPSRGDETVAADVWLPEGLAKLSLSQELGVLADYQWSPCETVELCRQLLADASRRLPCLRRLEVLRTRRMRQHGCPKLWNPAALELFHGRVVEGVFCTVDDRKDWKRGRLRR